MKLHWNAWLYYYIGSFFIMSCNTGLRCAVLLLYTRLCVAIEENNLLSLIHFREKVMYASNFTAYLLYTATLFLIATYD